MKLVRSVFDSLLRGIGLISRQIHGRRLILCYHRLGNGQENQSRQRALNVQAFEAQLNWLSNFAHLVSLEQLMDGTRRKGRAWQIAITFDDGYRDNIELGLPLLEKYEVPMTWFVTTQFAEDSRRLPWWILLDVATSEIREPLCVEYEGQVHRFDLSSEPDRLAFQAFFKKELREAHPQERDGLIDALRVEIASKLELPKNGFANPNEIRDAANSPRIEVGAHTITHPNMSRCETATELNEEIVTSKEKLEDWTGQEVRWFAYPFGTPDTYDNDVIEAVKRAGFSGAFINVPGYVDARSSRYEVPRLAVSHNWNLSAFKARVLSTNLYRALGTRK